MNPLARRLREEAANLHDQMKARNEEVIERGRDFSEDEKEEYERWQAAYSKKRKSYQDLEARDEQLRMMEFEAESRGRRSEPEPAPKPLIVSGDAENLGPRSGEAYNAAFELGLRGGLVAVPQEHRALMFSGDDPQAAHQVDSDLDGGFLVTPIEVSKRFIRKADSELWLMKLATVETLRSAVSLGITSLDKDPDEAEWTSELAEPNETGLKFGGRSLSPHPLKKEALISHRLIQRSTRNIVSLVLDRLGHVFNVTVENAGFNGDGDNKMLGIFVPSEEGIPVSRDVSQGNTDTQIGFDNLKRVMRSVPSKWRNKSTSGWAMHGDIVLEIDLVKDNDGQYVWRQSVKEGEPDKLLNRSVYETDFGPNTIAANQYVYCYADFSQYHIARSLAYKIQPHDFYVRKGLKGYIGINEIDGMPVLPEAFARGKMAAS